MKTPRATASFKQVKSPIKGANDEGGKFVDRNLMPVNPLKQQFEPTDAEPVRQQYKMAGGC